MDPPTKSDSTRLTVWPQWLAALEVFLMTTTVGLTAGWVSPYLAKLSKPDSQLPISKEEASWIAAIICIAKPAGSLLQSTYANYLGSKSGTWIAGFFFAMGWMCFFIENSVASILAYRILSGMAIGMLYNAFPLYIGEISDPKIRGALVSFVMQGIMVGNLMGSTMGAYFDTQVFAAISLVPNLLFIIIFFLLPHSPHHLIRHDELDEAVLSIQWYNRDCDSVGELKKLEKFIKITHSVSFSNRLRDLMTPINRKTLTMLMLVFGFFHLSGLYTVTAYMEIMLTKARVTIVAPANMVIFVAGLGIVSSWISIYTNDKFGRKIMLTLSTFGVALALFLWGLNFQLLDLGFDNPHLQWMSLLSAVLYKISLAAGLLNIPATLLSEMMAPNVKSLGACIINVLSGIFAFIGSRSYQPMVDALTEKYVFWIYASFMLSAGLYTMAFIPETKGKSLSEIQELLASIKRIDDPNNKENNKLESGRLLRINKYTFE